MARLKQWLREPLLYFLLIGAALFVVYRVLNPSPQADTRSGLIELTQDDLVQMSVAWLAQGRPSLTAEQMQSLVEHRVREEILYREAIELGLDKGDTIVRRRLAQKMEFLMEDVSAIREPSPEEIRAWFAANPQRFALSPRVSFRHLYFSLDRRGARAGEAAAAALQEVNGKPGDWSGAAALADPFMFQDYFGDRSLQEIATVFGPGFARALMQLKTGAWQGPIESGYGWHLVFVDSIAPSRIPALEESEPEVSSEWVAEQRARAKRKAYETLRARYQVVVPELPVKPTAGLGAGLATTSR
jgi:hypothetical protein